LRGASTSDSFVRRMRRLDLRSRLRSMIEGTASSVPRRPVSPLNPRNPDPSDWLTRPFSMERAPKCVGYPT